MENKFKTKKRKSAPPAAPPEEIERRGAEAAPDPAPRDHHLARRIEQAAGESGARERIAQIRLLGRRRFLFLPLFLGRITARWAKHWIPELEADGNGRERVPPVIQRTH
jgi:hypothetical protein